MATVSTTYKGDILIGNDSMLSIFCQVYMYISCAVLTSPNVAIARGV